MDVTDLRIMFDAFLAIMFTKAVVEPIALRLGRFFLRKADEQVDVIPDWIYETHQCNEDE